MFGKQIHHLRKSAAKPYFNMPIKSCHPEGINSININLVDIGFGLCENYLYAKNTIELSERMLTLRYSRQASTELSAPW